MRRAKRMTLDRYVCIDLETTGFSAQTDKIIQVGAVVVENHAGVRKLDSLVSDQANWIPGVVTQMTGLRVEDLESGRTLEEVMRELLDMSGSYPFVGHNISFDYGFLVQASEKTGVDVTLGGMRQGVDTLRAARKKHKFESNSLGNLLGYLNIPHDASRLHSAFYDAYMTKLLYENLSKDFDCPLVKLSGGGNYGKPKAGGAGLPLF